MRRPFHSHTHTTIWKPSDSDCKRLIGGVIWGWRIMDWIYPCQSISYTDILDYVVQNEKVHLTRDDACKQSCKATSRNYLTAQHNKRRRRKCRFKQKSKGMHNQHKNDNASNFYNNHIGCDYFVARVLFVNFIKHGHRQCNFSNLQMPDRYVNQNCSPNNVWTIRVMNF